MQFDEYPDGELQEKDFTVAQRHRVERALHLRGTTSATPWDHDVTVNRAWRMPKGLVRRLPRWGQRLPARDAWAVPGATSTSSRCSPTPRTRAMST